MDWRKSNHSFHHFIVFEAHHAHIINTFIENTMLAFTTTRSTALPFQKTIKTLKKTIREKAAYANKYKSKTTTTTFALAEDDDEFNVDEGKEDEDDDQAFIDSFERDGSATSSSSSSTYPLRVKSIDALSLSLIHI